MTPQFIFARTAELIGRTSGVALGRGGFFFVRLLQLPSMAHLLRFSLLACILFVYYFAHVQGANDTIFEFLIIVYLLNTPLLSIPY